MFVESGINRCTLTNALADAITQQESSGAPQFPPALWREGHSHSQACGYPPTGQLEEAKAAATRALALQSGDSATAGLCAALAVPPALATPLSQALRAAGLPNDHDRCDFAPVLRFRGLLFVSRLARRCDSRR
jgi:hypothetical protein